MYRFGYPQQISEQTRIHGHSYLFARNDHEANIVPRNALLLAYFRCYHCLEVIHSEQCTGYVLKYCSENSDAGHISVQNVLYEGHSISKVDKLQYYAATRISSASECFVGICGYWRHQMKPAVVILGIHFPGKKVVLTASPADALKKVDIPSSLERYLGRPTDSSFDELTYLEYHSRYSVDEHHNSDDAHRDVYNPGRFANSRKGAVLCIMNTAHPRNHELFALRLLLRRGPARSWEVLHTINDEICQTFCEAVKHLGLVANHNKETEICMQEAIDMNRPPSDLRFLLAQLVYYSADRERLE
jgi:hypothetical protein